MVRLLIVMMMVLWSGDAYASRSMPMPDCPVKGVVEKIELRKEAGQGMSDGMTLKYIDVTINVQNIEQEGLSVNDPNCHAETSKTLQMNPPLLGLLDPSLPKIGECINGYSSFMADGNFKSGNWLTVTETLPAESCAE